LEWWRTIYVFGCVLELGLRTRLGAEGRLLTVALPIAPAPTAPAPATAASALACFAFTGLSVFLVRRLLPGTRFFGHAAITILVGDGMFGGNVTVRECLRIAT